eukprot:Clim_evm56s215 gene=Clim_evmTU56s215
MADSRAPLKAVENSRSKLKQPTKVPHVAMTKTQRLRAEAKSVSTASAPAAAASKPRVPTTRTATRPVGSTATTRKASTGVKRKDTGDSTATKAPVAKKPKRQAWDYKGRLEDMESMTTELRQSQRDSQTLIESLTEQITQNNQRCTELQELKAQLEEKVAEKENKSEEYQKQIAELQSKISDADKEHVEALQKAQKELDQKVEELESKVKRLTGDLQDTEDKLQRSRTECKALHDSVATLNASLVSREAQLTAVKTQLDGESSDKKAAEERNNQLSEELAQLKKQLEEKENKIRADEALRRSLHNTIQELKGNIRVFCRVRPILEKEQESEMCVSMPNKTDNGEISIHASREHNVTGKSVARQLDFTFDRVFGPTSTQEDVFAEVSQLVQSALDGYNVCIFAYGQTGSGKTFTMEGDQSENQGIIPRSVQQIFETASTLQQKGWKYGLSASFVEIYNETVRDLLGNASESNANRKLEIRMNKDTGESYVEDLTHVPVETEQALQELLVLASKNRAVGETQMNERSSRSHSVFRLTITGKNEHTGENCKAYLNLVDLAGSERLSKSGSEGDRLKETQSINKSLSQLGIVITALSKGDKHVPFRSSKLTHYLQPCLGGNSKTLMFVNVSPVESNAQETTCSLRFATKVNNCVIGTAKRQSE